MQSILVAEGDESIRRMVRTVLENANYRVWEAPDGSEAFEIASREDIGLVVLDLLGRAAQGVSTLRKLRADPRTCHIPVVAMSGLGQYSWDVALWATSCLVKPFRPSQLLEKVASAARIPPLRIGATHGHTRVLTSS